MPRRTDDLDLDVDLEGGVVPISKAASSLAALIKRGTERRQPIIVTQKGYPTGVILPVELYVALRERAGLAEVAPPPPQGAEVAPEPEPEPAEAEPPAAEPEPQRKGRGGRRAKAAQ